MEITVEIAAMGKEIGNNAEETLLNGKGRALTLSPRFGLLVHRIEIERNSVQYVRCFRVSVFFANCVASVSAFLSAPSVIP